ncbi:MAG: response regulator [Parahaliea sp.]
MYSKTAEELESQHILLVDDDTFMLAAVGKVLSNLGFSRIERAENGQQALEILRQGQVDLLLTDVQMPVLNGLELTRQIRSGTAQVPRHLPVVIFTSFSNDDTLGSALALDVNGFLSKPVKPLAIAQKILLALAEEERVVRAVEDYATVVTDLDVLLAEGGTAAQVQMQNPVAATQSQCLPVYQLRPNMRLTREVRHQNGSLLLSAGFVLQKNTINRLLELRKVVADQWFYVVSEQSD